MAPVWQSLDLRTDSDEPWIDADPASRLTVEDILAELIQRPAWHADAACRDLPVDTFFPVLGTNAKEAKVVCSGCPVTHRCLDSALADSATHGVWAGTSERDRRRLRRQRAA